MWRSVRSASACAGPSGVGLFDMIPPSAEPIPVIRRATTAPVFSRTLSLTSGPWRLSLCKDPWLHFLWTSFQEATMADVTDVTQDELVVAPLVVEYYRWLSG